MVFFQIQYVRMKVLKLIIALIGSSETYSEQSQTSKIKIFAKTVNGFHQLTRFAKTLILDVYQGSECASTLLFVFGEFSSTYIFSRNSSGAFVTVDQVL